MSEPIGRLNRRPPVPEDLTREEKAKLQKWCREKFPQYARRGPKGLADLVERCLDHYRATGNRQRYEDWLAVCRNWIRKQAELDARYAQPGDAAQRTESQLRLIVGGRQ